MEVLLADKAGACYGVARALDLALDAAGKEGSTQTLGPLIHNPLVVADLEQKGLSVAETPADVVAQRVVIRSHGVTPEVLHELQSKELELIDATCPHVIRAQKAAYELGKAGKTVLIVGDAQHPEVISLAAWAKEGGGVPIVVQSPEEIPQNLQSPIGVVAQTTQEKAVFDAILSALENAEIDAEIHNTICSSTSNRQNAAAELAALVDAMVVIGGKNSANTTHLYNICHNICPKTIHIESLDELDQGFFKGVERVGVTAGASTPEAQISSVVDCLGSW